MDPNKVLVGVLLALGAIALIIVLGIARVIPFSEIPVDCPDGDCAKESNTAFPTSNESAPTEEKPAAQTQNPEPEGLPASTPSQSQAAVENPKPAQAPIVSPPQSNPQPSIITPPAIEEREAKPAPAPAPVERQARRGLPEIGFYTFDKAESGALPSGWTEVRGSWQALLYGKALPGTGSNVLHQYEIPKESADSIVISNDSIMKNVKIGANVRISNKRSNQTAGVVFRFQDSNHYYSAGLDTLNQRVVLFKTIAGVTRIISFQSTNRIRSDEWHYLEASATGEHLKVKLDDNDYISFKDESFTEGRAGLWTMGSTDSIFDNTEIRKMP